jgi:hypothetical protein
MSIRDIKRKDVVSMYWWCVFSFGKSKYNEELPKLTVNRTITDKFGFYDPSNNIITVCLKPHTSIANLCNTVIHEYVHYLQNMQMYDVYMIKYKRSYENHPYEISANNKAKKYEKKLKEFALSCAGNLAPQETVRTFMG